MPSPTKILHVLHTMQIGGAERAVFQLVMAQLSDGAQPAVLLAAEGGGFADRFRREGGTVHELRQRSGWDLRGRRRFRDMIEAFEIVHFHVPNPLLMACGSRRRGPAFVYTHRGAILQYRAQRRLMHRFTGVCLRRYFRGYSGNTQRAADVAAQLYKLPADDILLTYNGVDFSLLDPTRSREEVSAEVGGGHDVFRIGTCANLRDWKRVDWLLRAVALLGDLSLQCLIIGDGPALPSLKALAADLGIAQRVRFLGRQEHVADYLQVLDAFVLPSDESESFGNAAVEALGLKVPTLVMQDSGGLREHFPPQLFDFPRDHRQLAARLRELAASEDLRRQVGETGSAYVRAKYTSANMLAGYQRLYDAALRVDASGHRPRVAASGAAGSDAGSVGLP